MICITIQRTLSVAKVRYLIGDKECFKIFYPRFFTWINLFLLNHILLYSLLFPFQSIQTYVAMVSVFWMVYFVCIFSSFRVFCIKVSRRRRKTVLVPQTNFLRLWHGKKNAIPLRYKYIKMAADLWCNNVKSQIFYISKNSVNRYILWQV